MPDYTDFVQRMEEEGALRAADQAESRRLARFVAIKLGDLERTDEWSIFRQHVEKLRDGAAEDRQAILGEMEEAVGDTHAKLRLQERGLRERIRAYDDVLALPTTIREQVSALS